MDFTNPDGMRDLYQSLYLSEETVDEGNGLYANIHAKRARGERPARPGEKDYPAKDAFKKAEKTAKEEFDVYDAVLEYLCVEGYAETLEDAEWIMVNQLTSKDIEEILEGKKDPDFEKMKRQEYRHTSKAVKQSGGSRGKSKNRASKMSSIRSALERGEDPRADGYGGARAARGNPPEDHRAAFSKNPLNNPPRRVKKPGV